MYIEFSTDLNDYHFSDVSKKIVTIIKDRIESTMCIEKVKRKKNKKDKCLNLCFINQTYWQLV